MSVLILHYNLTKTKKFKFRKMSMKKTARHLCQNTRDLLVDFQNPREEHGIECKQKKNITQELRLHIEIEIEMLI